MARLARLVIPGLPHHVTQRGNRRQPVFFTDGDYAVYLDLLGTWATKAKTQVWAYCLMPNHVHLILVPSTPDGLRACLGETHRRYTRHVHRREDWRGHLWQERFHSFPMDERHLIHAARYIALNPVRAGLADTAEAWRWSSARAHRAGRDDAIVTTAPLLDRIGDWSAFIGAGMAEADSQRIEQHLRTGRPLGEDAWLDRLESQTGRSLRPRKPGPPPRHQPSD